MIQLKQLLSKLDFKTATIVALVALLLLTRMCSSPAPTNGNIVKVNGKQYEQVQHKVDTVTIVKTTTVYRPGKTIYAQPTKPTTPPKGINKDSIVKEYYGVMIYKDTLRLQDKQGYVSVTDTVSENKIVGRVWNAHINTQIIHDQTIIKELPRTQLYVGGIIGGDKVDLINCVGPAFIIKTKQDHIYSLGIGYNSNNNIAVQGGIFWKIKLHK
jgi:hypothetical protein